MGQTKYKVLFLDGNSWIEFENTVMATSPKGAMRAAVNGVSDSPGGTLVAVPLRSWQPQPVSVETTQRLKIG